jgi:hypothetical protein
MRSLIAGLGAVLAVACTDAAPSASVDASSPAQTDADAVDSTFGNVADVSIGVPEAAPPVVTDAAPPGVDLDATDLDGAGPAPLPVACDVEAGESAAPCPLPRSQCASSSWLVYYDDGQCVSGQCVWDMRYIACNQLTCFGGACQTPVTR